MSKVSPMSEEFHDWLAQCPVMWFRGEVTTDHVTYLFETPDVSTYNLIMNGKPQRLDSKFTIPPGWPLFWKTWKTWKSQGISKLP